MGATEPQRCELIVFYFAVYATGHSLVFGAFCLCRVIARQKTKHSAGSVWAIHGDLHKGEDLPEKPAAAMQAAVFGGNEA